MPELQQPETGLYEQGDDHCNDQRFQPIDVALEKDAVEKDLIESGRSQSGKHQKKTRQHAVTDSTNGADQPRGNSLGDTWTSAPFLELGAGLGHENDAGKAPLKLLDEGTF